MNKYTVQRRKDEDNLDVRVNLDIRVINADKTGVRELTRREMATVIDTLTKLVPEQKPIAKGSPYKWTRG